MTDEKRADVKSGLSKRGGESRHSQGRAGGRRASKLLVEPAHALDLAQVALAAHQNLKLSPTIELQPWHEKYSIRWEDSNNSPAEGNTSDSKNKLEQKRKMRDAVRHYMREDAHIRNSIRVAGLVYGGHSCGMSIGHRVRKFCIDIVEKSWFEQVILLAILANCVVIAMETNTDPGENSWQEYLQTSFTVLFTVELIFKSVAMGFALNGKHSYIRDGWNVVDFSAVLFGYLVFLPQFRSNLTVIRMIRLLRPLRTISSVRGMRHMVASLGASLPQLSNVMAVLMFAFVTFGIVGMQLFGGRYSHQCQHDASRQFNLTGLCGPQYKCPEGYSCKDSNQNPNRGVTSFDNFAASCLTILNCMSLEGWFEISVYGMECTRSVSVIYFVLLIFICAFFIVNLVVAVIFTAYNEQREKKGKTFRTIKKREQIRRMNAEVEATNILARLNRHERRQSSGSKKEVKLKNNLRDIAISARVQMLGSKPDEIENQRGESTCVRCFDCWRAFRRLCSACAGSRRFREIAMVAIIVNTGMLASEHYGQSQTHTQVLRIGNFVLTAIFTIELLVKVVGLPWKDFIGDGFNKFDSIIVALSLVEIALVESQVISSTGISAFRAFRLLRIFRLAQEWKQLNKLLDAIFDSVESLGYFSLLLVLFIFLFALVGVQFFGHKLINEDGEESRANFNTFWWSMVTVFQIIGGENWNQVLYDAMAGVGWYAAFYFVILYMFGNYVLLSLFLGILLSHFERSKAEEEERELGEKLSRNEVNDFETYATIYNSTRNVLHEEKAGAGSPISGQMNRGDSKNNKEFGNDQKHSKRRSSSPTSSTPSTKRSSRKAMASPQNNDDSNPLSLEKKKKKNPARRNSLRSKTLAGALKAGIMKSAVSIDMEHEQPSRKSSLDQHDAKVRQVRAGYKHRRGRSLTDDVIKSIKPQSGAKKKKRKIKLKGYSLCLFGPENYWRCKAHLIAKSTEADLFILAIIIFSTAVLPWDTPDVDPNSRRAMFLFVVDISTAVMFTLEAGLKIFAYGLVGMEGAYLMDNWNRLDFAIVIATLVDVSLRGTGFKILKVIRLFRALRPLRLIQKNENMRIVLASLISSIPEIARVFLVSCLFYIIFAILGVQLFGGLMYQCESTSSPEVLDVNKDECPEGDGYKWQNPYYANFDNIAYASLTLFEVSSLEGWPRVMYRAVDIQGENEGPKRDNHQWNAAYFIAFIVVGNFLVNNLFVGVVIRKFTRMKEVLIGNSILTGTQKLWLEVHHMLLYVKMKVYHQAPKGHTYFSYVRLRVFRIVNTTAFDVAVSVLICLNIIVLAIHYDGQSAEYSNVMDSFGYFFTAVFTLEAVLKIFSLGLQQYFNVSWNIFDFIIVSGSLIGIMISSVSFDPTILRVFRILRIFRVVKSFSGLKRMLHAMSMALWPLMNVLGLLMLTMFIYAIIGMQLFWGLGYDSESGGFINEFTNFNSFLIAWLTLLRCATGEDWNGIMHDCLPKTGNECQEGVDECGSYAAIPFFISYVVVMQFMLLNLYVAVVLDYFHNEKEAEKSMQFIDMNDLTAFSKAWSKHVVLPPWWRFWETSQNWVEWESYCDIIFNLQGSLSLGVLDQDKRRSLFSLEVPVHLRKVGFYEIEDGVSTYVYGNRYCVHYYDGFVAAVIHSLQKRDMNVEELLSIPKYIMRFKIIQQNLKARYGTAGDDRDLRRFVAGERESGPPEETTLQNLLAARRIQAAYRGYRDRKPLRKKFITVIESIRLQRLDSKGLNAIDDLPEHSGIQTPTVTATPVAEPRAIDDIARGSANAAHSPSSRRGGLGEEEEEEEEGEGLGSSSAAVYVEGGGDIESRCNRLATPRSPSTVVSSPHSLRHPNKSTSSMRSPPSAGGDGEGGARLYRPQRGAVPSPSALSPSAFPSGFSPFASNNRYQRQTDHHLPPRDETGMTRESGEQKSRDINSRQMSGNISSIFSVGGESARIEGSIDDEQKVSRENTNGTSISQSSPILRTRDNDDEEEESKHHRRLKGTSILKL